MFFLDQQLISYRYSSCSSSCWDDRLQNSRILRRFKLDRDDISQDCSRRKYTSIDGVGFSIWRHTFNMAVMTSFHAVKCYRPVSECEASAAPLWSNVYDSSWSKVCLHSYTLCVLVFAITPLHLIMYSDYRTKGLYSSLTLVRSSVSQSPLVSK